MESRKTAEQVIVPFWSFVLPVAHKQLIIVIFCVLVLSIKVTPVTERFLSSRFHVSYEVFNNFESFNSIAVLLTVVYNHA